MHPILFQIGFIKIYSYGFFIAIGFIFAVNLFTKIGSNKGYDKKFLENFVFYMFVWGIIGARVLYVFLNLHFYIENPLNILKIWEGGLVFWGGFLSSFVFTLIYLKIKNQKIFDILDMLSPFVSFGHFFGRIGCFFAGCCYGKETNSFFGVVFRDKNSLAPINKIIYPTQIYEAIINFLIFVILYFILKKKKYDGQVFGIYLILYSFCRFFIEFLRGDDRGKLLFFSVTQVICIVLFIVGIFILGYRKNGENSRI